MSNEYEQQGPAYHWKTELYKRLNLPVYDGVEEELEKQNKKRKKALDIFKSEKTMRRRVALKSLRVQEAQERILWTKQHGQDTYGGSSEIIQGEKKVGTKPVKRLCTKCGSNTHSLPTHHSCPYNSKKMHSTKSSTKDADTASDSDTDKGGIPPENTDSHSDYDDDEPADEDIDVEELEDSIVSGCICGAFRKAHTRDCPLNPRNKHTGPPKLGDKKNKPSGQRGKKTRQPLFRPGDYVSVHKRHLQRKHILCRVVECLERSANHLYRVCCLDGVISEMLPETSLTEATSCKKRIPLENWRTAARITIKTSQTNSQNAEQCHCKRHQAAEEALDLTQKSTGKVEASKVWIKNALYVLHESDREIIETSTGWLNDKIIDASQKLLAQHFPLTSGLEPPTLEQINGFRAHTDNFIQTLNIGNNHWIVVSTVGCPQGTVNVYDTMHTELRNIPSSTISTIARLTVCSLSQLTIRTVGVDPQKNSSDCGVLCVAIAFDLLSAKGPCIAAYNSTIIRKHLSQCLVNCCLTPFPVIGKRSTSPIVYLDIVSVDLFCICRMPEFPGDRMVECERCHRWFHQHCLEIKNEVFDLVDASWLCGRNDCK